MWNQNCNLFAKKIAWEHKLYLQVLVLKTNIRLIKKSHLRPFSIHYNETYHRISVKAFYMKVNFLGITVCSLKKFAGQSFSSSKDRIFVCFGLPVICGLSSSPEAELITKICHNFQEFLGR